MTPDEFKRHFTGIQIAINKAIRRELPIKIGNKAVKMFKQNFKNEGYFGEKWKDVRRRTNPPKHSHRPDNARRKILTGTGALTPKGKYIFGVVKVGDKGQIVLPVKARRVFGINPGDSVVVLGADGQGIAIIKEQGFLDMVSEIRKMDKE